jgi:uncharacterized protein YkwD
MPRRARLLGISLLAFGTACSDDKDPASTSDPGMTDPSAAADPMTSPTEPGDDETGDTGESAEAGDDGDSPVWDEPYCFPVAGAMKWPEPLPTWESEVVALVNAERARGGSCGANGEFPPSSPLTVNASLHCAARVHSKDMADRDFFDHVNPDGFDPFDRMQEAGYGGFSVQGENIAAGTTSAQATMDGWMASDGHCANILNPAYREIGVGAYEGGGQFVHYWTQTFAAK